MIDVFLVIFFLSLLLLVFILKLKEATLEQRILGLVIFITLPFEIFAGYLQSNGINNLFIYHILVPFQYSLYSLIFYSHIESTKVKKGILFTIPIVMFLAAVLPFNIQPIDTYNSYIIVLTSFFTCIWILIYYSQLFTQLRIIYLEREPLFWISTGLLFYSLGGFFVEGLMNNLINNSPGLAKWYYYNVYLVLVCFIYIMFIIAFICKDVFRRGVKGL